MPYPNPSGQGSWKYEAVPHLVSGIRADLRSDMMDKSECITLKNVLLKDQIVYSDTGYKDIAPNARLPIQGIPQAEISFRRNSGVIETLLVTTQTVYKWDTAEEEWQLITGTASTSVSTSLPYTTGTIEINVTSAVGFSVGDFVGIDMDDGSQHIAIIGFITGTIFTLSDSIPGLLSNGAVVHRAVKLAGNLDRQISFDHVPSHDWMVFTNGVDIVKRYDGTDCVDVPGLPSAGNVVCACVGVYNSALFLGNTVEGGVPFPVRIRRSDQADPTNWTTGTAGKDDLYDLADPIVELMGLGPYLIAYRSGSVARGQFIGAGGLNYQFDTMAHGDGLISANSVVDMDTYHIFVGKNNIYKYKGSFDIEPIAGPIFAKMLGIKGNSNALLRTRTYAFYVSELTEVWIAYCSTSATLAPDTVLRYDVETGAWYERQFANEVTGMGNFQPSLAFAWEDLIGSWDQQTWRWDAHIAIAPLNAVHLLSNIVGATAGKVYNYDYLATLDEAAAIGYTVETKDFTVPDTELRFDVLEVFAQGNNVWVQYSIDSGRTWESFDENSYINSVSPQKSKFFKQFKFNRVRFRFSGNTPGFQFHFLGMTYKIESLYDGNQTATTSAT